MTAVAANSLPPAVVDEPRLLRHDVAPEAVPSREVQGFGMTLAGPLPVADGWAQALPGSPRVEVRLGEGTAVERAFSGHAADVWGAVIDGQPFHVARGVDGDLLMRHQSIGSYHLAADRSTLAVAGARGESVRFSRTLLDSALFTTAMMLGYEGLHGTGLATPEGVLVILGHSGAGKSSLAAALAHHGLGFFADDIVIVDRHQGRLRAHAAPPAATVPSAGAPDASALAEIGDERWVARPVVRASSPIAGIGVLTAAPAASPLLAILPHVLRIPRERQRERFQFASDLVDAVPIIEIGARSLPPDALARELLARLRRSGVDL